MTFWTDPRSDRFVGRKVGPKIRLIGIFKLQQPFIFYPVRRGLLPNKKALNFLKALYNH